MMSLETRQRVWQARLYPRRQTSSVGVYGHVLAGWGIFHAQPFVLNERQVGPAQKENQQLGARRAFGAASIRLESSKFG
jgi:hypothetical protein